MVGSRRGWQLAWLTVGVVDIVGSYCGWQLVELSWFAGSIVDMVDIVCKVGS